MFVYACGLTEIVHNGSLMADDIEDRSQLRRGLPCTYLKYGLDYAVNASTLMYYIPIAQMNRFIPDPALQSRLTTIYNQEMVNLHIGQNWDITWHHGGAGGISMCPTEDQYVQMVLNKTSVLPRMCLRFLSEILQLQPSQRSAVIKYIETLGAAFQIQDDIIAVTSEQYAKERGVGEDIREGKRSLMVIHSLNLNNTTKANRLNDILNMQTDDISLLREAIEILITNGSVDYAKNRAASMMAQAWSELERQIPACKAKGDVEALSNYLIDRDI